MLTVSAVTAAFAELSLDLPEPTVLESTTSTNSDALALAEASAPAWTVVVADFQTQGRGRLDRAWSAEPGKALLFSVILRPPATIPAESIGWVPLLAGVALSDMVKGLGVPAKLKWPNDLVIDGPSRDGSAGPRKLAGILAERAGTAVVVGIGLNVSTGPDQLPVPAATSLTLEGADLVGRAGLLASTLAYLQIWWARFSEAKGNAAAAGILQRYRRDCLSIGKQVRVALPGRDDVTGIVTDIDPDGRLLLQADSAALITISAGDVVHMT